jgi:ribosomal biogenesis protein LAS1
VCCHARRIPKSDPLRHGPQIIAWRARKLELPLLLESTADIVEAKLRDGQQGVPSHALRLVYATAVSR